MAGRHPLQSSFAYGEMSPRLLGRSDTERYKQSLRICENTITFSHGNAGKRPGTRFLVESPTEGNIRLFDLQQNLAQPYVVEIGWRNATGGYLRLLDRGGYVLGSPLFITNGGFAENLNSWLNTSDANANVVWQSPGYAVFLPDSQGGGRTARLQQQVTVDNAGALHNVFTRYYSNAPTNSLTLSIGTTQGASNILLATVGTGDVINTFTPGVATFWITLEVAGAFTLDENVLDGIQIYESSAAIYESGTPWSNEDIPRLSVAESTQEVALYFAVESQPPQRFTVFGSGVFIFQAVPFTSPPVEWVTGNYPHTLTFYQQRFWLAGTPAQPDTLWGSQTNDFLNFALGTGLATEAIQFEMSDRGIIEWIQGAKNLLIGADVAEYILTSESGIIQPGDIQVQQQSAYGSAHQEPAEYANGVLYVGRDDRRIRFMQYQFLEDGWTSKDITWPSEHITKPLIKEMHFQYSPDPLIWMLMKDGTFVSAVYETEQNDLVGWHRHPFPEGQGMSTSLTKLGAGTEAWCAMQRQVNGVAKVYIERTEVASATSLAEAGVPTFFTDCSLVSSVEEDSPPGSSLVVNGLDPLEAFEVDMVIGGAVMIPQTVVGGKITLQPGFGKVGQLAIVGIGYTGIMRTLPLEGLNPAQGSSQSVMKRRNRIFLRVLQSTIPVINGITTPARFPITPMDEAQGTFTGDVQVADLGWDRFAEVLIEMPQPLRYNILALLGDAEGSAQL